MEHISPSTRHQLTKGFTLIELLIVIIMLGTLLLGLIFVFNPIAQINKGKDTGRENDLTQIKSALDSYYSDKGCYPTSLQFGLAWKDGATVYMTKIPQDPDYVNGSTMNLSYYYQTDGSTCPQWNVLYTGLRSTVKTIASCPLTQRAVCIPQGYGVFYNYCVISGSVDCSYITASTIPTSSGGSTGGSINNGGALTPTPTPYPITCTSYYACTGNNSCNSLSSASGTCVGFGGTLQCYCNPQCAVNGVKQCAN